MITDSRSHPPLGQLLASIVRFVWNHQAAKRLSKLLDVFQPDVVHLHNYYHQLSPSILRPLRKRAIPVVQTLHDYHLIDPTYRLFCNGKIADRTVRSGSDYWKMIVNRCIQQSLRASILEAIEFEVGRRWGNTIESVDRFIAPTEFVRRKHIAFAVPEEKIVTLHHPALRLSDNNNTHFQYPISNIQLLYVGRLSEEKGVDVLLEAMRHVPPAIRLDIVGDGPERARLEQLSRNLHLTRVAFHGWKAPEELGRFYRACSFVVIPSLWYEVFGFGILEAAGYEKPAIASRIGGIPELVENARQGLLVEAGNVAQLSQRIQWLAEHPNEQKRMGENAREGLKRFDAQEHWEKLEDIYEETIQQKNS